MINVCFITDEKYVIPTITAIQSIKQNLKSKANIYILSEYLSLDTIKIFDSLASSKLKIIHKKIENNPCNNINTSHNYVSKTAMIKFLLPQIFADIDKILYLDGDMIVQREIEYLFDTDISNKYAAVVTDMLWTYKHKHHIDLNLNTYFNSGMMLLNLNQMRKDDITQKLIYNKEHEKYHYFMDQDALNISFNNNIVNLPLKYNFLLLNFTLKEMANFYKTDIKEMSEIIKSPAIVHFAGDLKPWSTIEAPKFDLWFSYFKRLPNSKLKQETMKKLKSQLKQKKRSAEKEMLKRIFSVTNSKDKKHKIISMLGLKIKFRRSK